MDRKKLETWIEVIKEHGPTRVVINENGEATTPEAALRDHDLRPDIIYVRDDGWSLGTPAQFDTVASRMWEKEWVGVMWRDKPGGEWKWRTKTPIP